MVELYIWGQNKGPKLNVIVRVCLCLCVCGDVLPMLQFFGTAVTVECIGL